MNTLLRGTTLLFLSLTVVAPLRAQLLVESEFQHDVTALAEPSFPGDSVGYAGIGFDGTRYWVTKWASDRITRINTDGTYFDSFTIPNLTGTRSLTWDGTHFWAANNSTTLHRVDPTTLMVVDTLDVPAQARYASFDPSADGGAGGFWIGNFNSDILLVDMSGMTLATIPAASIGVDGRYGIAYDDVSEAQPFLWVFHQGGSNNMELAILDLPGGTARVPSQNLFELTPSISSGLAGGLFLTTQPPAAPVLLLALVQGTPNNLLLGLGLAEDLFVDGFADGFED